MSCLDAKVNLNKKNKNFLIKTEKELNKFFQIKLESPIVILLNSRQDIDKIYGKKTPAWLVGFVRKNIIFILHPSVYTKESSHKSVKDFWKTLKHEYCHLYYKQLAANTYPSWLNEGLACFLAKQKKPKPELNEALFILDDKKQGKYDIYKVGYFWADLFIRKFGRRKMLNLIKAMRPKMNKSEFGKIFNRVYKIKFIRKDLEQLYSKY